VDEARERRLSASASQGALLPVEVPASTCSGWYDYFLTDPSKTSRGCREKAQQRGREGAALLIGPWDHILGSVSSE
jgi:predicted acyl esterase